jgi:transcriptional regulator with XRE-family HTH domain
MGYTKAHWRMENTMAIAMVKSSRDPLARRVQDVDRHVGARMRELRNMLGVTQQQLAELIGITYQQAHKYEKGINRMAAGRLYKVAQVLGVDISYFFEGLGGGETFQATPQQRLLLVLARNFKTSTREHQQAICSLARALSMPQRARAVLRSRHASRIRGHGAPGGRARA